MGTDDVALQDFCRTYILPCCGYVLAAVLLRSWLVRMLNYRKHIRQYYNDASVVHKKRLFRGLLEQAESVQRPLTLMEFGVNIGVNFTFYPNGCDLLCLSPDANFQRKLKTVIVDDFPNIRLLDCVTGGGDIVAGMDDGCVDAVILTHTLHLEDSPLSTLRDIARVLRPNGRCYFVEHTAVKFWTVAHVAAIMYRPLYKLFGMWRGMNIDTAKLIQSAVFSSVTMDTHHVDTDGSLWGCIFIPPWTRTIIVGTATK